MVSTPTSIDDRNDMTTWGMTRRTGSLFSSLHEIRSKGWTRSNSLRRLPLDDHEISNVTRADVPVAVLSCSKGPPILKRPIDLFLIVVRSFRDEESR